MESYTIANKKDFMNKLLKSDLFDTFEVREVVLHATFKSVFDGARNLDFFADIENKEALPYFVNWNEMKPFIYHFVIGNKLPTYFKIILSTNTAKTYALSPAASTFFLNITFKDNEIKCSTGIAYKEFTLDKSCEKIWDEKMKSFLFKYNFL
ncbi:MAG: DUF5721 family protein [Cellulosilyticaceae bacterium]